MPEVEAAGQLFLVLVRRFARFFSVDSFFLSFKASASFVFVSITRPFIGRVFVLPLVSVDGRVTVLLVDGRVTVLLVDGRVTVLVVGRVTVPLVDGRVTVSLVVGRVTVLVVGRVTVPLVDGRVTVLLVVGRVTVLVVGRVTVDSDVEGLVLVDVPELELLSFFSFAMTLSTKAVNAPSISVSPKVYHPLVRFLYLLSAVFNLFFPVVSWLL